MHRNVTAQEIKESAIVITEYSLPYDVGQESNHIGSSYTETEKHGLKSLSLFGSH